jgi:DNA invertase Pin-like site-specific DNA recombinase
MIKVAEWIRVSDESQAAPERFGIPAQKTVNRETCKRNGLEVIETFQVEDVSGKDIMLASETHDLIKLMKSGRIQGVVAREFSRLMRPDDFADYVLLSEFQKTKTILYLPEGTIDFNDKMGRLMAGMQASISGYERSTIRERLHRGNEENRKSGGRFASTLPKGVGHSKELGWHYTEEAQVAKHAYGMVLAGESLNEVAKYLGMSATGARYLIHNPIYKGWRVYERECGEAKAGTNGRQAKYRPMKKRSEDKVIRVQVIDEPLVSPEMWDRACQILDVKSDSCRRNRKRQGIAAYNGFLFCDECGRVLTPHRGSGAGYYVCLGHYRKQGCEQKYTRITDLESRIDSLIGGDMADPAFLRRLAHRLQSLQQNDKRSSRISQLETEQKSLERKRSRVIDMFMEGDITTTEKAERLAKVAERLAMVNEELTRLQASVPAGTTLEQLVSLFTIFAGWDTYSKDDRRKLLSLYVPRMRVRDGQVVSVYRLLDGTETRVDNKCSRNMLSDSKLTETRVDSECSKS